MNRIRRWIDSPRCDRDMAVVWAITLAVNIAAHNWPAAAASFCAAVAHLRLYEQRRGGEG